MDTLQEKKTAAKRVQPHKGLERLAIWVLFVALLVFLVIRGIGVVRAAVDNSYQEAKKAQAEQVEQQFYDMSFEIAERAHHVQNRATISVEGLRAEQNLQVLRVSEVAYRFHLENPEGNLFLTLWDQIAGDYQYVWEIRQDGIFSVNLQAAEFITDPVRQTVLVRVPRPELSSLKEQPSEIVYKHEGVMQQLFNLDTSLPPEEYAAAVQEIRESILSNESYLEQAKNQAVMLLENLIRQLNPHLPNLQITVEFF